MMSQLFFIKTDESVIFRKKWRVRCFVKMMSQLCFVKNYESQTQVMSPELLQTSYSYKV
jgi:hypothetical protein